jgi:hypothetical protein
MGNFDFAEQIKNVTTESVYVLTEKNKEVVKALRLLPGNRPIKAKKVESLVEAYKRGVYIPPILVALPYRFVTEGNHRLAAALECIERGIPFTLRVYMYRDDDSLGTARLINNTQDRWKANDRLDSYVYERKEAYVRLKEFMDLYPSIFKLANTYSIQAALCILALGRTRQSMRNAFNSGKLVVTEEAISHGKELMEELILISEILDTNSVFVRDHSTAWDKARNRLGISFNQFIVRLRKKADSWEEPKDSVEAWFTMYLKIAGI